MKALKESDEDKHKDICTKVREDGAYIEGGENDNFLVQKVSGNPGAVGVMGYSFLEENTDQVRGIPINGIAPTSASIASFEYPGARPLFLYVKGEHLTAVPGLREYVGEFAKASAPNGYLSRRGLIPLPADQLQAAQQAATELKAMTADGLK
jgi:phosphate transport system substrate-binding protein